MKIIPVVFYILCLFLLACSKEQRPQTYRLDPEALKYIQPRPYQYFIYKDSASGNIDSVVATEVQFSYEEFTSSGMFGESNRLREKYSLTLTNVSGGNYIWLSASARAGEYGVTLGPPTCFSFPSETTAMTVEGTTYLNVIVTNNDLGYTYCWAPSVGLIKLTRSFYSQGPNHTFTLIRHN